MKEMMIKSNFTLDFWLKLEDNIFRTIYMWLDIIPIYSIYTIDIIFKLQLYLHNN